MINKYTDAVKGFFENIFSDVSYEFKKGISIAIVAILVFASGNAIGSFSNVKITQNDATTVEQTQQQEQSEEAATVPDTTVTEAPSTEVPATQAPATTAPADTQAPTDTQTPAASDPSAAPVQPAPSGVPTTPAEIIALFNESANKVKTDATKVVKNFEKRTHDEDKLIIHPSIQGLANSLMAEAFKDDNEPIEYATKEDIIANYQVPGETWVSQLTEAEVASATCTDNGTEYEITLNLNATQNPENGVGVSKGVDTITSSEIKEKAPDMVKGFDTEYSNCVIKCKIDKASGRTTWSNYTTPVILKLKLDIPLVGDFDAQVGMTFEKDYTITY